MAKGLTTAASWSSGWAGSGPRWPWNCRRGHEVLAVDDRLVQDQSDEITHAAVDATSVAALRQIGAPEFDVAVVGIGNASKPASSPPGCWSTSASATSGPRPTPGARPDPGTRRRQHVV